MIECELERSRNPEGSSAYYNPALFAWQLRPSMRQAIRTPLKRRDRFRPRRVLQHQPVSTFPRCATAIGRDTAARKAPPRRHRGMGHVCRTGNP